MAAPADKAGPACSHMAADPHTADPSMADKADSDPDPEHSPEHNPTHPQAAQSRHWLARSARTAAALPLPQVPNSLPTPTPEPAALEALAEQAARRETDGCPAAGQCHSGRT